MLGKTQVNSINIYCLSKRGLTPTVVYRAEGGGEVVGGLCTHMAAGLRLAGLCSVGRYLNEVLVAGV